MITVEAPFHQNHGRPRDVLRYIEEFLSWQDHAILTLAVEVDGDWYVPAWVFDG